MMNVLWEGIYNKYIAGGDLYDALYVSAGYPGMYLIHAPQGAVFPYCVYGLINRGQEYMFADEHESVLVYFNLFTEVGQAHAGTLLSSLLSLYDNCDLTVTGWSDLQMLRDSVGANNNIDRDPPVYGYHVEYDIVLERTI